MGMCSCLLAAPGKGRCRPQAIVREVLRRMPNESLTAFVARSYLHEARSARGQRIQLSATPFVLIHLTVCVGFGLLVGAVVGIATHDLPSKLGHGIAAGVSVALFGALVGLGTVAICDRGRRRDKRAPRCFVWAA